MQRTLGLPMFVVEGKELGMENKNLAANKNQPTKQKSQLTTGQTFKNGIPCFLLLSHSVYCKILDSPSQVSAVLILLVAISADSHSWWLFSRVFCNFGLCVPSLLELYFWESGVFWAENLSFPRRMAFVSTGHLWMLWTQGYFKFSPCM